jgi:adenosine deaminase
VRTESVPSYYEHHFARLYEAGHPVVLCTDDSGVFDTTLSEEYAIAGEAFKLCAADLTTMAKRAIDYAFCADDVKDRVRAIEAPRWNASNV